MYTASGKIDQDALIREYLPVVRRQALSLQVSLPSNIELDDLIQAGVVGLLEALGRFNASAGATFMTFASQRIRGAMIDELRTRDWLPRSVRRKARSVESCIRNLEQQLQRAPEEREIAEALNMKLTDYRQLLSDTNNGYLLPFEELVGEGTESAVRADEHASPFELVFKGQKRDQLIAAIGSLPEREQQLLALYYQEERNLKEIGLILGITESRVSQLHSQAVGRIRAKLAEESE